MTDFLAEERSGTSFDIEKLIVLMDGGADRHARKVEIRQAVEADPVFSVTERYYLSREEEYNRALKINVAVIKKALEIGLGGNEDEQRQYWGIVGELLPLSALHHAMFIPTIIGQANAEQKEEWLMKAMTYQMIGTYAQTELGHGSFLQGIETTATYDKVTQEFVLNSPTTTSMKWWPGGLGKSCTHCILMAKLIIDGQDKGMHAFFLPLRSLDDHKPFPGITVGDIGPKFAWNAIDNGFLKLTNVRIPRMNMLMKYAKVSPEGQYTKPPHAKIAYGTMISVRAFLVRGASRDLAKGVTIAVRYSCVRRQGYIMGTKGKENKKENKIMDYQLQQYALLPLVAAAYAIQFTGDDMLRMFNDSAKAISEGDLSQLPELHATSSGLKAYATWLAAEGLAECRQRCGGMGFLRASGLPDLYAASVPACTYEGDNNVLIQQLARYLLKAIASVVQGNKLTGNVVHLNAAGSLDSDKCPISTFADLFNPQNQLAIYRHKATRQVVNVARTLETLLNTPLPDGSKPTFADVWNSIGVDFHALAKSHCYLMMLQSFIKGVADIQDKQIQAALKRLCDLFALYHLEKDSATALVDGYFTGATLALVNKAVKELLAKIRPDAVGLVDGFDLSDRTLVSAIGRRDGNVYEAMYKTAQLSQLNKTDVAPGHAEHVKPLMDLTRALIEAKF